MVALRDQTHSIRESECTVSVLHMAPKSRKICRIEFEWMHRRSQKKNSLRFDTVDLHCFCASNFLQLVRKFYFHVGIGCLHCRRRMTPVNERTILQSMTSAQKQRTSPLLFSHTTFRQMNLINEKVINYVCIFLFDRCC